MDMTGLVISVLVVLSFLLSIGVNVLNYVNLKNWSTSSDFEYLGTDSEMQFFIFSFMPILNVYLFYMLYREYKEYTVD